MAFDIALLVGGVAVLAFAADRMVQATASLANRSGLSPFIIGAVIIGFGTSLPELMVSVLALDQPNGLDLAVGNVVGSNIANICVILGSSVLFFSFSGQAALVRREGILMLASLIALSAVLWDMELSGADGAVLSAGLIVAAAVLVRWSRSAPQVNGNTEQTEARSASRLLLAASLGLAGVVAGARAMVLGAESIALELGIAEGVVGLTILALGTSLPELGASLASARRGHGDLVFGNVLGSNVFNALGVAGATGLAGSGGLAADIHLDLIVMMSVAVVGGVIAWTGDRMVRVEGALLLALYPVAIILAL